MKLNETSLKMADVYMFNFALERLRNEMKPSMTKTNHLTLGENLVQPN